MAHDRADVFQDGDREQLQRVFEASLPADGLRKVLDAGCGYKLPIDVPHDAHLTGIDQSPDALGRNRNADRLILGDIQTFPLSPGEFDAIVCWWVLEHVPDRTAALANLARSLRPGGLMVLGVPHVYSLKAAVTWLTPFGFHVWVLKHFMGVPDAGSPGVEPYPTFLRRDLAPRRLERTLLRLQLTPVYAVKVRSGDERGLPSPLRMVWNAGARLLGCFTLGRWNPHLDEYVAIFRKSG